MNLALLAAPERLIPGPLRGALRSKIAKSARSRWGKLRKRVSAERPAPDSSDEAAALRELAAILADAAGAMSPGELGAAADTNRALFKALRAEEDRSSSQIRRDDLRHVSSALDTMGLLTEAWLRTTGADPDEPLAGIRDSLAALRGVEGSALLATVRLSLRRDLCLLMALGCVDDAPDEFGFWAELLASTSRELLAQLVASEVARERMQLHATASARREAFRSTLLVSEGLRQAHQYSEPRLVELARQRGLDWEQLTPTARQALIDEILAVR